MWRRKPKKKIDLRSLQHGKTLEKAYKSFFVRGLLKAGIDGYVDRVESHVKALIEDQLKEIQSSNTFMTL